MDRDASASIARRSTQAAEPEASIRLAWVDLHQTSRALLERIGALRDELAAEGVDRVVLCGMGGSSLAPAVICATAGVDLVVLDGTDPAMVSAALAPLRKGARVVPHWYFRTCATT